MDCHWYIASANKQTNKQRQTQNILIIVTFCVYCLFFCLNTIIRLKFWLKNSIFLCVFCAFLSTSKLDCIYFLCFFLLRVLFCFCFCFFIFLFFIEGFVFGVKLYLQFLFKTVWFWKPILWDFFCVCLHSQKNKRMYGL